MCRTVFLCVLIIFYFLTVSVASVILSKITDANDDDDDDDDDDLLYQTRRRVRAV